MSRATVYLGEPFTVKLQLSCHKTCRTENFALPIRLQAEHLVARGHYAAARRLLHRSHTLSRAHDHPEAEARSLLVEAKAQASANDFSGAIMLIQQAQCIGGALARSPAAKGKGSLACQGDPKRSQNGSLDCQGDPKRGIPGSSIC